MKSHIPLTCEEHKKENGISERRIIEEARTEALIRTCGKCKVRILKEYGCNKVVCTSCYAVLCDVCGEDISKVMYNHFDGEGVRAPPGLITVPGGKCPLYDGSSKRKDEQVDAAEKEAMAKVRSEHPEIPEEDLKIKFAEVVQQSTSGKYGLHGPFGPYAPHGHAPHGHVPHGLYGANHVWVPPQIPPPPADLGAGLNAAHPILEARRPRPFHNNAPEQGVRAAARPAALGAIHNEQHDQWVGVVPIGGQAQQAAQKQQTAYQRFMDLQQQQQQLQRQILAWRLVEQRQHQIQTIQQQQAERLSRLHIPLAPDRGLLGGAGPNDADRARPRFADNKADPFPFNPALSEADGPFNPPAQPHLHHYRPNRVTAEDDIFDPHHYRQRATRLDARIERQAGERSNQEAALPQTRPFLATRRGNALVGIDPQATLNKPWL